MDRGLPRVHLVLQHEEEGRGNPLVAGREILPALVRGLDTREDSNPHADPTTQDGCDGPDNERVMVGTPVQ